jgi:hypothetical protein
MDPVSLQNSPQVVFARMQAIRDNLFRDCRRMRTPNFTAIGNNDLARLFRLYDEHFFNGWLAQTLLEKADAPLGFRLSSTMTSAGGKTIRSIFRSPAVRPKVSYEIAIASRLLFMTFGDIDRPVIVCGLPCASRLDALQRIMEHEILHLTELLTWNKSSCKGRRFLAMARRIFGHTKATHDLVTPRERAAVRHGIKPGDLVQFDFDGLRLLGRINRITQRATVLVEAGDGIRYSDGRKYKKFYVPLPELTAVAAR